MNTVIIIGAGQLGSRHLQAIALSNIPLSIHVYDPSVTSLKISKARYDEIPNNPYIKEIHFYSDTDFFPKNLDLAIIATTASVRFRVTEELLMKCRIKYIVFEKVLFQRINEYFEIKKILESHLVQAWVNCPRRMFPYYKKLREELAGTVVNMIVQGGDWGIACNGIHFIDLLSFFSGSTQYNYSINSLDSTIHKTKRKGYIELTGVMQINDEKRNQLTLQSMHNSTAPLTVSIITKDSKFLIDEVAGTVKVQKQKNNYQEVEEDFVMLYQSQLSHIFVKDLLETGTCRLTDMEESISLHIGFIDALLKKMTKIQGTEQRVCSIT